MKTSVYVLTHVFTHFDFLHINFQEIHAFNRRIPGLDVETGKTIDLTCGMHT